MEASQRVGILGGGQLGRMLALAGYPLGLRFRVLDPSPLAPAGHGAELIVAPYDDGAALDRLAAGCAVVTYEFENVPAAALASLEGRVPIFPPAAALHTAQDRCAEKGLFRRLSIPTPRWQAVATRDELRAAVGLIGLPAVLKSRRMGYDGKGQTVLRSDAQVGDAWDRLGGVTAILETLVSFDRELSILAVRGRSGETSFYPLVETVHGDGILRSARAPAPGVGEKLQRLAEDYASRVLFALDYVGVLAIEWFEVGGQLLANEMACRVHNSGHWTLEGAVTSQFENHLRAILGWPLGSTSAVGHSVMVNLIGGLPDVRRLLAIEGAHVHLYGKCPAPRRKLGHVTIWGDDEAGVRRKLDRLRECIDLGPVASSAGA